jgi:hypothetical protein
MVTGQPDPIQVLREWVAVTARKYGRVRLIQTVNAEQAETALQQVEALVEAAWNIWPDREQNSIEEVQALRAALAPFKDQQCSPKARFRP